MLSSGLGQWYNDLWDLVSLSQNADGPCVKLGRCPVLLQQRWVGRESRSRNRYDYEQMILSLINLLRISSKLSLNTVTCSKKILVHQKQILKCIGDIDFSGMNGIIKSRGCVFSYKYLIWHYIYWRMVHTISPATVFRLPFKCLWWQSGH